VQVLTPLAAQGDARVLEVLWPRLEDNARAVRVAAARACREAFHPPSRELGANYFDERWHSTVDRLTRRIKHLGYCAHLEPVA